MKRFDFACKACLSVLLLAAGITSASAAAVTYNLDPDHTHPSFEVDHFGGLSVWRGTFRKSTGTVELDTAARTGTVDITIDPATIDFANDKLNADVLGSTMLDVAKYSSAAYKGTIVAFAGDAPKTISGRLTLHGITKPVTLTATLSNASSTRYSSGKSAAQTPVAHSVARISASTSDHNMASTRT